MNIDTEVLNRVVANSTEEHKKSYSPWSQWDLSQEHKNSQFMQIDGYEEWKMCASNSVRVGDFSSPLPALHRSFS